MLSQIEVDNRKQGTAIRSALTRPDVRAFCAVVGLLEDLPSDRSRRRVLAFVEDKLNEERWAERERQNAAHPHGEGH